MGGEPAPGRDAPEVARIRISGQAAIFIVRGAQVIKFEQTNRRLPWYP